MIDGNVLASINRKINPNAVINFKGAENLKTEIPENLSILKYVRNNTVLDDVKDSLVFDKFFSFVEKMLFFRSLRDNNYIGIKAESSGIQEDIISRQNVKKFELFLNNSGIECVLDTIEEAGNEKLAFNFNGVKLPFFKIASQGTIALSVFYFWLQRIKEDKNISFLFIDEFDAYYHHKLSKSIVQELKGTGIQFVLTTHNPTIMNNHLLRPDCYFVMNSKEIKTLSDSTDRDLREAHNLEKLYKSSAFDV
jgi:AAA15 family ATPase/GTPase